MIGLVRSAVALASTPLSPYISGALTHRFRSDTGVTMVGAGVSAWANMVASNNATQSTSLNRPARTLNALGTKPAITFDGTNSFMDVAGDGTAGARTYIFVARSSRTTANRFFDHGTFGNFSLNEDPRALIIMGSGNYRYFLDFTQADDGSPHVFTAEISGVAQASIANNRVMADAAAQVPSTTVSSSTTAAWSGMRLGGGASRFSGDMFEVLIYSRVLTAAELARVHLYLISYYGL